MGKFVVKTVSSGVKFDLKAGNGETILTSEVYTTEAACRNGIASVQKNAPIAGVEDLTTADHAAVKHPKFELYEDKSGEYRFRLKATNGEIIGTSEGYAAKTSAQNGIASVQKNAADADILEA